MELACNVRLKMINTIIFDIGNVLMHYDFMSYVRRLWNNDEKIVEKVTAAIWKTGYWNELDKGVDEDRIISLMLAAEPEYAEETRITIENIGQTMSHADYAIPWVTELKERGYKILSLSNYSELTMRSNPSVLDFMPYMDGGVFSCYVRMVKPDPGIYQKICDEYDRTPENCVFIDDNYENVCAAKEFGLNTIHFTGLAETKKELECFLS